ncbi:MAG: shikimate dehydrogenase [Bacteroidales bacterium]|nr:shikimate dehydrogenase [Bacteroidales bacterium]
MRKFGLIGYPLSHSFSKKYFTEKFHREKISDCSYDNYPRENLARFQDFISGNPELCGLNVTIPFKKEILNYVDVTEPQIKEIGAVNVLKIKRIGDKVQICGYNSDVTGIRDSIKLFFPDKAGNALIFGTGGSSGAVCYTLKKLGFKVTLVSRTKKPGIMSYQEVNSKIMDSTDLIVNTTPLGMFPDIMTKPEIDYNLLKEKHILFDLVYNPEITSFLMMGKERGCKIVTGLKMLYSQAERSWEIWNDVNL